MNEKIRTKKENMMKKKIIKKATVWALISLMLPLLRITGVITWSWVWVLCPLWIVLSITSLPTIGVIAYLLWLDKRQDNQDI